MELAARGRVASICRSAERLLGGVLLALIFITARADLAQAQIHVTVAQAYPIACKLYPYPYADVYFKYRKCSYNQVIRDNLAGSVGMVGAFASQAPGIWGMPGTVITSPSNGALNSYRVMVYGDYGGADPTQQQWEDLDFQVHFWNSVAAYFASPQNGDVQALFTSPSNADWFTAKGTYAGRTQYHFQFNLSTLGMAVTNGQEFVIAVEGIENPLSARLYHSFSTTPPTAGSDVYASHTIPPNYFSNLGAPTNWVGSKVVITTGS